VRLFLTALLLVVASTAGAAEFTVHEGPNEFVGEGGEKTVTDGVDFWHNGGSPPRKFKLLGYLTADVNSAGLNGMISMKRLPGRIAKQTKELGGDAVIILDKSTTAWQGNATITTNNTNPYMTTANVNQRTFARTKTRYAVVKYLNDQPADLAQEPAAASGDDPDKR
jgi:hypothetical protein